MMVKARLLSAVGIVALVGSVAGMLAAQAPASAAFDVASVKPNKSGTARSANFPLGPGDVYSANGGLFVASQPLGVYISFAYKLLGNQLQGLEPQLPSWAITDLYEIQARATGNPSKDQMRLMMRSLLADRFKLAIHHETRQVPVLALVLAEPGKIGPQLRQHPDDTSCTTDPNTPTPAVPGSGPPLLPGTIAGGFPALCNGILGMPPILPGNLRIGGRNLTMAFMAESLSGGENLGRPIVDLRDPLISPL
jgi:uncharacterized protein (TIGR03435 family)